MLAIEDRASIFCARLMRGTMSIAIAVDALRLQALEQVGVLCRVDEADDDLSGANALDLLGGGRRTLATMSAFSQSSAALGTTSTPASW